MYKFGSVFDANRKLKELSKAKRLSGSLSTQFDTDRTGKFMIICNGGVIYLNEKDGGLLTKELNEVFGVKDGE